MNKNELTMKKNQLKYEISKIIGYKKIKVSIALDDDCHNGHNDFSITAEIYEKKNHNSVWKWMMGGCCHDEILKHFSDFKCFVDLHLSDVNGAPMYAIANGFYFLSRGEKDNVIRHFRITDKEFNWLSINVCDEVHLAYLLHEMGVISRWKQEAEEAIRFLEQLTGEEFEDNSTKLPDYILTPEQLFDMRSKISTGYYTLAAIQARKEIKVRQDSEKLIYKLSQTCSAKKQELDDELNTQLYIISTGLSIDNFIYYSHKKEGVFNWSDWKKRISRDEFDNFMKNIDLSSLPDGIKFILK